MDVRLRNIVSKAAGTYFIVTDNSQVTAIENESKLRLVFINTEKGPVNSLYYFAKGNQTGFNSIFGKGTRLQQTRGNFSIPTCLEMLNAGPIAVVNLRAFDDTLDKAGIVGLNVSIQDDEAKTVAYQKLFNANGFWVPKAKNIVDLDLTVEKHLVNFANIGNSDVTIIVTKAKETNVTQVTTEGDKTLAETVLEIPDYPALNTSVLLKDTFVDVYVFANSFGVTALTNKYYGQYFDASGNVDLANIEALSNIAEAGLLEKFTGTLIPSVVNERGESISIDTVVDAQQMTTGLICHINEDLFESAGEELLDMTGMPFFEGADFSDMAKIAETSDVLLSHIVPLALTAASVVFPPTSAAENVAPVAANFITYKTTKVSGTEFLGSFEQGLRMGDKITSGVDGFYVEIIGIDIINEAEIIGVTTETYKKVKYTCNGQVDFAPVTGDVYKVNFFVDSSLLKPTYLASYKPRLAQFTDGTASKQSDILDMMNNTGIVKGVKSVNGLRYLVDAFKSFAEPNYKYQFGILETTLDEKNKFARAILNEPFVDAFEKSVNPLFRQSANDVFEWSYVPDGGNKTLSSKLLTKFNTGASLCFYFGPGNIVAGVIRPLAGLVSNLFYSKAKPYDIVANENGYIDGIVELETTIDSDDRAFCEAFRYNPVIFMDGVYTIYGNLTGQKAKTAQQQIQNSELLCYIKGSLYALGKGESFKKGTYDSYMKTETEVKEFMKTLALDNAIQADYIVQCNAENNTKELQKNKIKLIHLEYTPYDSLEKIVFDLNIN